MSGLGSLPSSRLTKLLQEKAELLKKRRQRAEAVAKELAERLQLVETSGLVLPDRQEELQALKELERTSDWEGRETQGRKAIEQLDQDVLAPFEARCEEVARRADRLAEQGRPLPSEARSLLDEAVPLLKSHQWADAFERLSAVDEAVRQLEVELQSSFQTRVEALARWAAGSDQVPGSLLASVGPALRKLAAGAHEEGERELNEVLLKELPTALVRRETSRTSAEQLVPVARELGVPTGPLEALIEAEKRAAPLDWPESVSALERSTQELSDAARDKARGSIEGLRETLESLRAQGVEPDEGAAALEQALATTRVAPPAELPGLLARARDTVEGPVVAVVAGILDEVRPRLVEARRFGRDPSEVFAAMNRAREALRLRIYGEAIAASQEALDRVTQITEDFEAVRTEAESVRGLIDQLGAARFPVQPYEGPLAKSLEHLGRGDLNGARRLLRELVDQLGRAAMSFFQGGLASAEQIMTIARERGFLPTELGDRIAQIRTMLDEGRLAETGERLGQLDVELRAAVGPYLARRLEELEKGLSEVPEEALVTPVRRLMADADVQLRVKEDLASSLECLRRAEREFASVFAARASSLVEALAQERRVLEDMGGAGDEIQREIDEVEQIFNMGDFVKASKAAQEIKTRTLQQQLVRSEDAISHAKLALVELGTMGLDVGSLKTDLEQAQEMARANRFADAYHLAEATTEAARRLKTDGQEILDLLAETEELVPALAKAGLGTDGFRASIQEARHAYQEADFPRARAVLAQLKEELGTGQLRIEAGRLLAEAKLLIEDGQRLAVPMDDTVGGIREVAKSLEAGKIREAHAQIQTLHSELTSRVRPVLEEHLRALEADADAARGAGLDLAPVQATLAEARRRLAQPVPVGVAELVDTARTQFFESRGFLEHADRAVRRATEALNQAELVRVDVGPAREKVHRLEKLVADREFGKAIELASAVERELNQATYQQVSKSLANFQGMVARARREGANTTVAENFLAQSKAALENSQAIEALQLAARAESEIERVELQHQIARASLETLERRLESAEKDGVLSAPAAEKIAHARAQLAHHEYVEVLDSALTASDALALARESHRRSRDAIDNAERQIAVARELRAETREADEALEDARQLAGRGDYAESIRRAREAAERALWATERLYTGALEDARRTLEMARRWVPTKANEVGAAVEEAESALKAREWRRVTDRLSRAQELAEGALQQAVAARRQALEASYQRDLALYEGEKASRAEFARGLDAALERKEFDQAFEMLAGEESRLSTARIQQFSRRLKDLESALLTGEKLGVDTTPSMKLFSEAKMALEAGKMEAVPELIDRAHQQVTRAVIPRVEEKLREIRAEMVFARDGLNVTLGPVPELLDGIPRLLETSAVLDAARALLTAEEQLNGRKTQHRELMNLQYLVDAQLAQAASRHVDATKARDLLAESIDARSKDYAIALERARQAHELLKSLLRPVEAPPTSFWPFRRPPPGES
jgi:hypothetical protein